VRDSLRKEKRFLPPTEGSRGAVIKTIGVNGERKKE